MSWAHVVVVMTKFRNFFLDSRIYNSTLAKNSSPTQLSCPPSPIISLMKDLLIFVCIYWIDVESISTPWEFSNEHCMMMSLSVSFPVEWECSTNCKHMVRFWNLQEHWYVLMKCTRIATCREFGHMKNCDLYLLRVFVVSLHDSWALFEVLLEDKQV